METENYIVNTFDCVLQLNIKQIDRGGLYVTMELRRLSTLLLLVVFVGGCATRPAAPPPSLIVESPVESADKSKEIDLRLHPREVHPSIADLHIEKEKAPAPKPKPKPVFREKILDHKYFRVSYDPGNRLARYVMYELKAEQLRAAKVERKDKFRVDPLLVKMGLPYVQPTEYAHSGYDRGHLAPSADFAWSQEANEATFVMSNIVPQTPNLNRDAWRRLEEKVRRWACGEEHVTVITGPLFSPPSRGAKQLPKLKSGLVVPERFFKIVIDETPPRKTLAFVFHQSDRGDVLRKRAISFSTLNREPGFHLPGHLLERVEIRAPASISEWKEKGCTAGSARKKSR